MKLTTDKVWLAFDNLPRVNGNAKKEPIIFNVQHTTLFKPEVIVVVVLFFQVNGIARFGGFEFVGLALVGKDIVF